MNECSINNGGCSSDATCTNTDGSFICKCNNGYFGNGVSCTGEILIIFSEKK